jgi:uncharacterized membrane protein YdbT with pleckstrin-like domain
MNHPRHVSVLTVATVSAALQCGLAVLFVLSLSFLFALTGDSTAASSNPVLEYGMTVVLVALVLCAIFGFVSGAFTAFLFNMFVSPRNTQTLVPEAGVLEDGVLLSRAQSSAQ